jgi:hypothetical protein
MIKNKKYENLIKKFMCNIKIERILKVRKNTYVLQLVEVLILYGMLTPHLLGRPAAMLLSKPEIAPAALFKQLQAV